MNDPYHVYMDLDVINHDYSSTSKPQLRYEETRNTPCQATVLITSAASSASVFKRAILSLFSSPRLKLGPTEGKPYTV